LNERKGVFLFEEVLKDMLIISNIEFQKSIHKYTFSRIQFGQFWLFNSLLFENVYKFEIFFQLHFVEYIYIEKSYALYSNKALKIQLIENSTSRSKNEKKSWY